jgi:signal transduction histidine kinase
VSPRRWPAWAQDLALAAAFATAWFTTYAVARGHGWYPLAPDSYLVAGIWTTAVLAVRRLSPAVTLVAVAVGFPVAYAWGPQTEFHLLPVLLAGYTAASLSRLHTWVVVGISVLTVTVLYTGWTGVLSLPAELASAVTGDGSIDLSMRIFQSNTSTNLNVTRLGFAVFATAVVVLLGSAARRQRETLATLVARNAELERLRAVEAEQVAASERTRIARELHDVAAHHLTAMVIRAQAADRVAARDPAAALEALPWITDSSREALTAMRQTVRVLRSGPGGDVAPVETRTPEPELDDLPDIVERVRAAGLAVDLTVGRIDRRPLPHVQLAAVRIVQESLTNVLAHAHATRAVVQVAEGPSGLTVVVEDDGRGFPPGPGGDGLAGHGLLGMRERAASCGGDLQLGRSPLGGGRVSARLPLVVA